MTKKTLLLFLIAFTNISVYSQDFKKYFSRKTLRLDIVHTGNTNTDNMTILDMKELPYWSGSLSQLKDLPDYGDNYVEVYDSSTEKLIFSKGYNSLFKEWQRLPEAQNTTLSFYEIIEIPYPKNTIKIILKSRNKQHQLDSINTYFINPSNYMIKHDKKYCSYKYKLLVGDSLNYNNRLDLVFLSEGYTQQQLNKFSNDAQKMYDYLISYSPFDKYKNKINVWLIYVPSADSGTDDPRHNIFRQTAFNSSFNTFGSDRYLTTTDLRKVYDAASIVPHDQIYILVNTNKYGGGGIYNFFSLTSTDHPLSKLVFVHEFGHALAGLADEYYYDEPEYQDYYPSNIEPWEPNITTLVNFKSKWKNMVADTIPIPTPDISSYYNVIGVFEGGGYRSKGVYRPMHTCIMKTLSTHYFCPVCQKAIKQRLDYYTK